MLSWQSRRPPAERARGNRMRKDVKEMSFMDAGFLLSGETARKLYDQTAGMPIFDYHNHLNPQEIVENKNYGSVTSMWLARDHYKWRILRAAGAPERCICGEADDREKFRAFAAACEKAIGSPVYYWTI